MRAAPRPENEQARLENLLRYEVLDSEDESVFDELTELASHICGTPISLVSLIDHDRQWFKSRVGLEAQETERSIAFCSHAILQDDVFEVPNASEDMRFVDNPLVTGSPDIRFYAGAPLVSREGYALGTLCVIDQEPRQLTESQKRALQILAKQVIGQLELRLHSKQISRMNAEREKFYAILAHDIKSPFNGILNLARILKESASRLLPEQITELSNAILTSSMSLYQLVEEVLQWTQNRLDTSECVITELAVDTLLDDAKVNLTDAIALKKLKVEKNVSPSDRVRADATLAKTVLRNLIANAIKFSPEGGSLRLSARKEEGYVIIRIEDQGPGVADTIRRQLFRSRVESQAAPMGEVGNGLGLFLSQDFMKLQGGEIRLDETYRKGAAFEVVLPCAD